jgi:hypothetical protein
MIWPSEQALAEEEVPGNGLAIAEALTYALAHLDAAPAGSQDRIGRGFNSRSTEDALLTSLDGGPDAGDLSDQ